MSLVHVRIAWLSSVITFSVSGWCDDNGYLVNAVILTFFGSQFLHMYKMDRKGSAELLSCDTNRSKHASCDSLASDSKSSSLNSKLGRESVSILAVNCLYCVSFTYTHRLQPAYHITIISSLSGTRCFLHHCIIISILAPGTYRPPTKRIPVPSLQLKKSCCEWLVCKFIFTL